MYLDGCRIRGSGPQASELHGFSELNSGNRQEGTQSHETLHIVAQEFYVALCSHSYKATTKSAQTQERCTAPYDPVLEVSSAFLPRRRTKSPGLPNGQNQAR